MGHQSGMQRQHTCVNVRDELDVQRGEESSRQHDVMFQFGATEQRVIGVVCEL